MHGSQPHDGVRRPDQVQVVVWVSVLSLSCSVKRPASMISRCTHSAALMRDAACAAAARAQGRGGAVHTVSSCVKVDQKV